MAGIDGRGRVAMKALVYRGPGRKAWDEKPHPAITFTNAAEEKALKVILMGG